MNQVSLNKLVGIKTQNISFCIGNNGTSQMIFKAYNIDIPFDPNMCVVKNVVVSSVSTSTALYGLFCDQIAKTPIIVFGDNDSNSRAELFFPMYNKQTNYSFVVKELRSSLTNTYEASDDTSWTVPSSLAGSSYIYLSFYLEFLRLDK